MFLVIEDPNNTTEQLCNDLCKINRQTFHWKIIFNPDPSMQAKEVILSHKDKIINHSPTYFKDTALIQGSYQKHLGLMLHKPLSFEDHIKTI